MFILITSSEELGGAAPEHPHLGAPRRIPLRWWGDPAHLVLMTSGPMTASVDDSCIPCSAPANRTNSVDPTCFSRRFPPHPSRLRGPEKVVRPVVSPRLGAANDGPGDGRVMGARPALRRWERVFPFFAQLGEFSIFWGEIG